MPIKRKPSEIKRDKKIIADYYLHGDSQMAIVEKMKIAHNIKISQTTVFRDLKAIQQQWKKETNLDIDEIKIVQLKKIDNLEREFWAGWHRSYGPTRKKTIKKKTDPDGTTDEKQVQEWELAGDPRFLQGVLQCIERRCKILGIDQIGEVNVFQNVTFAQFVKQHFSGNGQLK